MLKEFIHDDLVFVDTEFADFRDTLSHVAETLVSKNYVLKDFQEALLAREEQFPTGLQLDGYAVGIPHGGPQYVRKEFVAIVTTKNRFRMYRMDAPSESLEVDTLFILGFSNSETHLKALKELMQIIQNPNAIKALKTTGSTDAIFSAVRG